MITNHQSNTNLKMKKAPPTVKEISKRRLANHLISKEERHERNNILYKESITAKININKKKYKRKDLDIDHFNLRNPFILHRTLQTFYKSGKQKESPPEPTMMTDVYSIICDIDPTFYKIIEGRPLRRLDDIKVYMSNIRDIFLFKANAAYLYDQIINADASLAFEMAEYNKIYNIFIQCKNEFVKFAKTSYNTANILQIEADKIGLRLKDKTEELDSLGFQYVKLTNKITDMIITYETLSIYRNFLDQLTPLWLTTENTNSGYFAKDAGFSSLSSQDLFPSGGSLNLDRIHKTCLKKVDTKPYFKHPKQLLDIFENKRLQSLHYMQLGVHSAKILAAIGKSRELLKTKLKDYVVESLSYKDIVNTHIKIMEEKAETYKSIFYKILFGEFHKLYASFDASKLYTCVQFVHTIIFGGIEDPKDEIKTLMHNIERLYFQLSLDLEGLDLQVVKRAKTQVYDEDKKTMNNAFRAQRILKECDILSRALYTSFEPPRRRQ